MGSLRPAASTTMSYSPAGAMLAAVAPSRNACFPPGIGQVSHVHLAAQAASAVSMQNRPIAPQPSTATRIPADPPASRQACTALAAGSIKAAVFQDSPAGSGRSADAGTATRVRQSRRNSARR